MKTQTPKNTSYDVVIIGGAMMGASAAWFLSDDKDFDGMVLVVDRDLNLRKHVYDAHQLLHAATVFRRLERADQPVRR